MRLFTFSLLILLGLVGSPSFAQDVLLFPKESHDFGLVMEGDIASTEFEFENTTDDTVRLANVKPSCGCTSPFWTKDPIAPGESGNIKINYNSKGRPGEFVKNVTITIDGYEAKQQIRIKGVVEKPLDAAVASDSQNSAIFEINKTTHAFGKVEKSKPISVKFKVTNSGNQPLKIESVKAGCHCISHQVDKTEIAAGESATLELTYTPRYLGEAIDKVVINTNDAKMKRHIITLRGEVVKSLVTNSIMQQQSFGF